MKIRSIVALVGLAVSFTLPTFAQQANDLIGAWTLVSITLNQDGKKTDMYGPSPQGQKIVDASGHYSLVIIRSDLPKFASSNREAGTPEENKAAVQGSIAFFGTYTVDEAAKTLTQHVDSCRFPNWNRTDRKLSFSLFGDELHVTPVTKASTGTGTADLVWKRAK
jgi:hypothetical protein